MIRVVLFSLLLSGAFGACPASWTQTPYKTCVRYFNDQLLNWTGAVDACGAHSADLVSVPSKEDSIWFHGWVVLSAFESDKRGYWSRAGPWLGGYADSKGFWHWKKASGDQTLKVYLWGAGEPNNVGATYARCLHYHKNGFWNDAKCTAKFYYICEKNA